jgi:hypothetical protein
MAVDLGPDAYAIFAQSRAAVTARHYPDSIQYTISVAGLDGATPRENHYRAYSEPGDGVVDVAPISEEEAALPPPVPHGINFFGTAFLCGGHCETGSATVAKKVGAAPLARDLIGVPILDPTYMFGLRYAEQRPRAVEQQTTSELPIIATVSATKREYRITFAGTATIDGVATYHLLLTPVRKPKENRLRELWIGTDDYLPRKAVTAGDFTIAPLVDVPWTVNFTILDGAPFISRETAGSTLYLQHHRIVRDAEISFEQIRTTDSSPIDKPLVQPAVDDTTLLEPGSRY